MLLPLFRPPLIARVAQADNSAALGGPVTNVYSLTVSPLVTGTYGPFAVKEALSIDYTMNRLDGQFMDVDVQGSPDAQAWTSLFVMHFDRNTGFVAGSGQLTTPWLRFVVSFDALTAFANLSIRISTRA